MLANKQIITLVLTVFTFSACGVELVKPLDEGILEAHGVKSSEIQQSEACAELDSMSQEMDANSSPEDMNEIAEAYSECADTYVEEPIEEPEQDEVSGMPAAAGTCVHKSNLFKVFCAQIKTKETCDIYGNRCSWQASGTSYDGEDTDTYLEEEYVGTDFEEEEMADNHLAAAGKCVHKSNLFKVFCAQIKMKETCDIYGNRCSWQASGTSYDGDDTDTSFEEEYVESDLEAEDIEMSDLDEEYVGTELETEDPEDDPADMYCTERDSDCDPDYFEEKAPEYFPSEDEHDDFGDSSEFEEPDNCALMIGFGGDCGANAGEDLYWPENQDVRVRIDGHNFDFQENGFIDGPFTHNGGFTIKTNVAGHLEADIHIGKKKDGYTSDLDVHLSIVNGIARVKGTAKGQKVDARVKVKGHVIITFDGHTVSW